MNHSTSTRKRYRAPDLLLVTTLMIGLALGVWAVPSVRAASSSTIFAISSTNNLLWFDSAAPGTILGTIAISGLQAGESLVGIDVRPANGQLYGVGSTSRLYSIDFTSGAATQVGAGPFAAVLGGVNFGVDFNPVADRVRVVSDADQNLRLNPNDGTLSATDGTLAYAGSDLNAAANPNIVGAAYTNSFAGAAATTLYGIDSNLNILTIQNPPNSGTLNTVGPLGFDTSGLVGFDIATAGTAFASLSVSGLAGLFAIDLVTGAATPIGSIGTGATAIRDIAVAPAGVLQWSAAGYTVAEKSGTATITVIRTGGSFGSVSVDVATSDGTASAAADYSAVGGTLLFNSGEVAKTLTIPISDDGLAEDIETIHLSLSNVTGTVLGLQKTATLTIADDELPPSIVYALSTANNLLTFSSAAPGTILSTTAISGLQAGERLLGIDVRPATGQLYALGSTSRLYTLDPLSGVLSQVGAGPFAAALAGTDFGFDFNPVPDRIRVVSDANQNLRLNPNNAAIAGIDVTLAYAAGDVNAAIDPNIVGVAYTNNIAGATTTTLYGIDSNLDILAIQNPPNNGTLNTVGPLGADSSGAVGFDIAPSGTAIATLTVGGVAQLYRMNLVSGSADLIGPVGAAIQISDIAIAPPRTVYLPLILKW
jgi:hypothetical protein